MEKLFLQNETYQIIGICMEVHRVLGYGFSEIVYKDALEEEAIFAGLGFEREKAFHVFYKEKQLKYKFLADFVFNKGVIVEVKASEKGIAEEHIAQTLNYIKVCGGKIGLIVNFGKRSLEHKRLIF